MNYLWEVALKADDHNVPREKLNYKQAKTYSPYMEVAFTDINTKAIEEYKVEVNPFYRFSAIFSTIFDINLTQSAKTREILFDVCMQYMIQLDLRHGLTKSEYYMRFFLKDILNGMFGQEIAEAVKEFNYKELRKILVCMLSQYRCGTSMSIFRQAIKAVYPSSIVYMNNEIFREILIYIGINKTEKEEKKVKFLLQVFLPIDYTSHLFWEHHFGIIDIEETMKLDEMVLF